MKQILFFLLMCCTCTIHAQRKIILTVQQPPELLINAANTETSIVEGESVQLGSDIEVVGGSGSFSYLWEPDAGLNEPASLITEASPGSTTTYSLTVFDEHGCSAILDYKVTVNASNQVDQTANNETLLAYVSDQHSGYLEITLKGLPRNDVKLQIVDLLGRTIYRTTIDHFSGQQVEQVPLYLRPGGYLLRVNTSSGNQSRFFVVY